MSSTPQRPRGPATGSVGPRATAANLPPYYSSLDGFRTVFATGNPVLMYHHVGPRQSGARLKGLYLSPRRFIRQLAELEKAGFFTPAYSEVLRPGAKGEPRVFLTFDDGFRDVWSHALPALGQTRFRAILFVVADLIGKTNEWQQRSGDVSEPLMDAAQIREWLAAGHEIGAHTLTHPRLTRLSPEAAREEIAGSRKKLEDLFGHSIRHFCYPYGDWDERVRGLAEDAGFETACTTESGINTTETPPHALKRITARYPSRSWKTLWARFRQRWRGSE